MNRYFLDESGHGGDLATSTSLKFSGQPVFALACVGAVDEKALAAELDRLRSKFRCSAGELKSSALGAKLPDFSCALTEWLVENDAAIFVELVEKRHFVAIHIVNHLLCGPYNLEEVNQLCRSHMAELLSDPDFDLVLLTYLSACRSQLISAISVALDLLWAALEKFDGEIARSAQLLTMYARDNLRQADAQADDFLPIADESSSGKKVWILPNLQSLTNIYGRINQSCQQGLHNLTLVHDIQLQYGKILGDAKGLMEKLAVQHAMPFVPFADYQLRGNAALAFATASDEPCLQAADIIAGCAMRYARSGMETAHCDEPALRTAFFQLFDAGNPFFATGINLVISDRVLNRLQVPYISSAPYVH